MYVDKTVLVWWYYPTMVTFLVRFLAFLAGIFVRELNTLCIEVHDGPLKVLSSERDPAEIRFFR
jgi:hypothetical protein